MNLTDFLDGGAMIVEDDVNPALVIRRQSDAGLVGISAAVQRCGISPISSIVGLFAILNVA